MSIYHLVIDTDVAINHPLAAKVFNDMLANKRPIQLDN